VLEAALLKHQSFIGFVLILIIALLLPYSTHASIIQYGGYSHFCASRQASMMSVVVVVVYCVQLFKRLLHLYFVGIAFIVKRKRQNQLQRTGTI
jgi:hypothetical protein